MLDDARAERRLAYDAQLTAEEREGMLDDIESSRRRQAERWYRQQVQRRSEARESSMS